MSTPRGLSFLVLAITLVAALILPMATHAQQATPPPTGGIGMARRDDTLAYFDFTLDPGDSATDSVNIFAFGAPARLRSFTTNLIPG